MTGASPTSRETQKDELNALLAGRPIVLVGMMGAGKTTVGRRLATRLGRHFVDSDEEVERAAGMSIEDIFAAHGEAVQAVNVVAHACDHALDDVVLALVDD